MLAYYDTVACEYWAIPATSGGGDGGGVTISESNCYGSMEAGDYTNEPLRYLTIGAGLDLDSAGGDNPDGGFRIRGIEFTSTTCDGAEYLPGYRPYKLQFGRAFKLTNNVGQGLSCTSLVEGPTVAGVNDDGTIMTDKEFRGLKFGGGIYVNNTSNCTAYVYTDNRLGGPPGPTAGGGMGVQDWLTQSVGAGYGDGSYSAIWPGEVIPAIPSNSLISPSDVKVGSYIPEGGEASFNRLNFGAGFVVRASEAPELPTADIPNPKGGGYTVSSIFSVGNIGPNVHRIALAKGGESDGTPEGNDVDSTQNKLGPLKAISPTTRSTAGLTSDSSVQLGTVGYQGEVEVMTSVACVDGELKYYKKKFVFSGGLLQSVSEEY